VRGLNEPRANQEPPAAQTHPYTHTSTHRRRVLLRTDVVRHPPDDKPDLGQLPHIRARHRRVERERQDLAVQYGLLLRRLHHGIPRGAPLRLHRPPQRLNVCQNRAAEQRRRRGRVVTELLARLAARRRRVGVGLAAAELQDVAEDAADLGLAAVGREDDAGGKVEALVEGADLVEGAFGWWGGVGVGWSGLGWVGWVEWVGWSGLEWVGVCWVGWSVLGWVRLGYVGEY